MSRLKLPLTGVTDARIDGPYRIVANSTERLALTNTNGLKVWQTDASQFYVGDGTTWNLINGSAIAPSDTYYVSTTGNDTTGNGSRSQPWASLSKAVTEANANATAANPIVINMEPGSYTENNSSGPIAITAEGISIVGDSPNAVLISPNTVGNNLITCSSSTYFQGLTISGVTGAVAVTFTGTLKIQRMVEVTFSNCQTCVQSTNTGTGILEACIFQLYTTGLDIDAGEFICGNVAFLGSLNPASPSGNGVTIASGAKFLADTVRMSFESTGVDISGQGIIYNHDIVSSDVGVEVRSGADLQIIGSTFRNVNTVGARNTGATAFLSSCHFLQNTTSAIGIDTLSGGETNISACVVRNFSTATRGNNSSEVRIFASSFTENTTTIDQVDSGTLYVSLSNSYESTKISIVNTANFSESSFLGDLQRQRTTGSTEVDGFTVFQIETTDPTAEANKVIQYAKNSTDPTNTELMLHFNGGNGSTTFTDESASARTVTTNGDAQQSTAIVKFGVSAGLFDGAGDYLTVSDKTDISWAADFTVEFWMNTSGFSNNDCVFENSTNASNILRIDSSSGNIRATLTDGGTSVASITGGLVSTDQWVHVAFVRSGNDYTLYLDGVSQGTDTSAAGTTATFTSDLFISARSGGSNNFDGYIDEFRISSEARYTSSFNRPVTPFDTPVLFNRLPDGTIIPVGGL